MELDAYQIEVQRTQTRPLDAYPETVRDAVLFPLDRKDELRSLHDVLVFALGLAGEAGEVCDLLKKVHGHGKPYDAEKLKNELGDVLWYVAALSSAHGFHLSAVAQANVDKLRARYPNGFSVAAAAAKADESGVEKFTVTHVVTP